MPCWRGVDRGRSLRSTPGYPLGPRPGSGLPGADVLRLKVPGSDVAGSGGLLDLWLDSNPHDSVAWNLLPAGEIRVVWGAT